MDRPAETVFSHLRSIQDQAFQLIHDIDAQRKLIERYFCAHPSTSEIQGRWHPLKAGHIPMEWVLTDGADSSRRILYMHGGSWISGDAEVLLDDSRRLARHAAEQGCDVTLEVWEGMPPVFQGFAPFLPEALEAIARIGQFVRRH